MELTLRLTGTKPMLQHNGRLANPTDPYVRELKLITSKRKKTEEDLIRIMQIEARGACWETEDGKIGVPAAAVWRTVHESAKMDKLGKSVERALSFTDVVEPLLINGQEWSCDDYLSSSTRIDYRGVKVGTSRTMRARPLVLNGWQVTHTLELMADVIDPETLVPIIKRSGRLYGIGDWRPNYGTFAVEVSF